MISYSISQMESYTGINSHSLRIWERRYAFLNPKRSTTNIRHYSEDDMRKLLNIKILIKNGYKLSQMDLFSDEQIRRLAIDTIDNSSRLESQIDMLTRCMMELDEPFFNRIFDQHVAINGFLSTITELMYPFLNRVGIFWCTNKVAAIQEHFISNLIRQKILSATGDLPIPSQTSPGIVMFLLSHEDHEIGLLVAAYIARSLGWKVYYLGSKVPVNELKDSLKRIDCTYIMTMFSISTRSEVMASLNLLVGHTEKKILVSGSPGLFDLNHMPKGVKYLAQPAEFIPVLKESLEP